jgi:ABC-type multidrug transport system permease subunit
VQYLALVFLGVLNFASVLSTVSLERAAYYRERATNMYATHWYSMVMTVVELPYQITSSLVFTFIFYWMVGLRNEWGYFFYWWLTFFLFTSFMTFLGVALCICLPNQETSLLIGALLVCTWNMFCGFMIPLDQIPSVWKFLYYFNPLSWALQAVLATQYYCDGTTDCATTQILNTTTGTYYSEEVWQFTQDTFSLHYDRRWIDIVVLLCCMLGVRVVGFLGLRFISHMTR